MTNLIWALDIFAICFALHLVWWMKRPPRRQTRALAYIFLVLPALLIAIGAISDAVWFPMGLHSAVALALFCAASGMAYIITYSAVEADSPTLMIALLVDEAGPGGLDEATLVTLLGERVLLVPRLRDLVRDGLAVPDDQGRYRITAKGQRLLKTVTGYRRLLGLGEAQGG